MGGVGVMSRKGILNGIKQGRIVKIAPFISVCACSVLH